MANSSEDETSFDEFMDIYGEKENELLHNRKKYFKQYEDLENLEGKNEYVERDMMRYRMYYAMWSISLVVMLIISIKMFGSTSESSTESNMIGGLMVIIAVVSGLMNMWIISIVSLLFIAFVMFGKSSVLGNILFLSLVAIITGIMVL